MGLIKTRKNQIIRLGYSKKIANRRLSMCLVTYLIEYLGEFEFIFETVLDYESRDQMGSFEAKKTKSKISCLGTFKTNDPKSRRMILLDVKYSSQTISKRNMFSSQNYLLTLLSLLI